MKYLVVDLTQSSVKDKAKYFARLIWKLIRPDYEDGDITKEMWGIYKHPTLSLGAMQFDEEYVVPFNLYKKDGSFKTRSVSIIEELVDLLYPTATKNKKEQIRTYVKNNPGATIEQILPSTLPSGVVVLTQEEADKAGWFPKEYD